MSNQCTKPPYGHPDLSTATTSGQPIDHSLAYLRAGLSAIPVYADGSKKPAIKWKAYQNRLPTSGELQKWFHLGTERGIAVVMGQASGDREALDFDMPGLYEQWAERVEHLHPGLVDRITRNTTPRGGMHVIYRCEQADGNTKLAEKLIDGEIRTLIETRGEGGYILVPGSPAACHETGRLYEHVGGPPITDSPKITVEERATLWSVARSFNEYVPPSREVSGPPSDGNRPGDGYNKAMTWADILVPAGWSKAHASGATTYWRRPGKGRDWSATTGHCGDKLFVFSSNASPFQPQQAYSKFAAYALLTHGGDFKAAACELVRLGYADSNGSHRRDHHDGTPSDGNGTEAKHQDRLRLLTRDHLDTLPPPSWLIEGVIHDQSLVLLYAAPGVGKSFLMLDWSLCVSMGLPWFGRATTGGNVVYIAAEGASGLLARVAAWETRHDTERTSRCFYIPECLSLFDALQTTNFMQVIKESLPESPSMVVVDTLSRCVPGADENSQKDMGQVVQNMDRIRNELSTAVVLVHHSDKQNRHERGSTVLRAAADTVIALESVETGQNFDMTCEKQKDAEPFERLQMQLSPYCESCVIELPPASESRCDRYMVLLPLIHEHFGTGWASTSRLEKLSELPSSTFYRALKWCVDQKLFERKKTRNRASYKLTRLGVESATTTNCHATSTLP